MIKYRLTKLSSPGWQFDADEKHQILWLLDQCVCNGCKRTQKDIESTGVKLTADDIAIGFFPSDYSEMNIDNKISALMSTACGAEYHYID